MKKIGNGIGIGRDKCDDEKMKVKNMERFLRGGQNLLES